MLSDDEKRDLLELAASADMRRQSEELRLNTVEDGKRLDLDSIVAWLGFMSRTFESGVRPDPPTGSRFLI